MLRSIGIAVALLWSWGPAADALTIDDFEAAQSLVVGTGSFSAQAGVATGASAVGGARDVIVTRDPAAGGTVVLDVGGAEAGVARLSEPFNTAGGWNFRYDGSLASLPLHWSGLGGVDLTDGGIEDRFRIVLQTETALGVAILISTDENASSIAFATLPASASFSVIDIPFVAFAAQASAPVDWAHVGSIVVDVGFFSTLGSTNIARIDSFSTVPEPGAFVLLAGGLVLLARSRRRTSRSA